jgi:hypothetical protein
MKKLLMTYSEMAMGKTEQFNKYADVKGISSSRLVDFFNSPDHVLKREQEEENREEKVYFEEGDIFEIMLRDWATGNDELSKKYVFVDIEGDMQERIPQIIKEINEDPKNNRLADYYIYTQKGTLHGSHKKLHAWLDILDKDCLIRDGSNPEVILGCKFPIGKDQLEMFEKTVEHAKKMQISELDNMTLEEIIAKADAIHMDKSYYWKKNGKLKKCLFDLLIEVELMDGRHYIAFDFKLMANLDKFRKDFMKRYWIQDRHYSEALVSMCNGKPDTALPYMIFIVGAKEAPYLTQAFSINSDDLIIADAEYNDLVEGYQEWLANGKPEIGWKPMKKLNFYGNN